MAICDQRFANWSFVGPPWPMIFPAAVRTLQVDQVFCVANTLKPSIIMDVNNTLCSSREASSNKLVVLPKVRSIQSPRSGIRPCSIPRRCSVPRHRHITSSICRVSTTESEAIDQKLPSDSYVQLEFAATRKWRYLRSRNTLRLSSLTKCDICPAPSLPPSDFRGPWALASCAMP